MKFVSQVLIAVSTGLTALPAMAGVTAPVSVPEPLSLSILAVGAGGAVLVRTLRNRRK